MNTADRRRRWSGVLCLGIAILMVVWGQFFLPTSVAPLLQIGFWFLCFAFTLTAILIAFADLMVLRQRSRDDRRALLEETILQIEKETKRVISGP